MTDFWITTHWPTPDNHPPMSRHVYVKENRTTLPKPGAVVFIREAIDAKDKDGRRVRRVDGHHHGNVMKALALPKGSGGIIGVVTVQGTLREQQPSDVVFDYGDLPEWLVIPCRGFSRATLPLTDLRAMLGTENVRGLNLWAINDDDIGAKLLKALRR
jgi:hypothetical protein